MGKIALSLCAEAATSVLILRARSCLRRVAASAKADSSSTTMVAVLVVVYFGIVDDTGNSCTWEGAVGCGAGEALLPSRIESDKSKSGMGRRHITGFEACMERSVLRYGGLFSPARWRFCYHAVQSKPWGLSHPHATMSRWSIERVLQSLC